MINRRVFLLVLLITFTFLLLMYLNEFTASSPSSISIEIYQQQIQNLTLPRTDKGPIIFSKFEYLNQTRKVKLFSSFLYVLYYCIYYSQVRTLFVS
jgi:hypothetical protein